ncbi:MAG: short-chain dehydrogenase [Crocinitomicaceae bacterium]|nr:short-chain dehydrogenase [Crocinitomicaceae bacterium]|tara:strand:- start:383 stop:1057 length:675 start_codon:yes stop_codon:yes gene_type:complete
MNIVITGCSKGIGFELAKKLSLNHKVYGISRDEKQLKLLKKEVSYKDNIKLLVGDVTKITKIDIDNWVTCNGVDVLINNAGYLVNKPFTEINHSDFLKTMDVNMWGVINMTKLLLDQLNLKAGQIINIGSIGGVNYSSKYSGLSLYSSSKGALTILSECLAEELDIKVNVLALGAVQTEMLSKAFPGYNAEVKPSEMADYIIDFIENGSKMLNGQIIKVTKSNP